jgi:hypothetical protein
MVDSKDAEGNIYQFPRTPRKPRPTSAQRAWLNRGLMQPGNKLPLFDEEGQRYTDRTIRICIEQGWAEPWFNNTLKPDWMVCRLTDAGRKIVSEDE